MKPRAMSEWIVSAASSAVRPRRSVHARVSLSPAVKKLISPSSSLSRRTTSSSADAPSRNVGRFLLGQLRQLGLELEVDPVRAVLDREQRLRRQRLEPGRQLARPVRERAACVDVREHPLELRRPPAAASARPTSPASSPARADARRGRGRRRAARAAASRGRRQGRACRRSRRARRAAHRPGAGSRAAPARCLAPRRRGSRQA